MFPVSQISTSHQTAGTFADKVKRLDQAKGHMENAKRLCMFGRMNIAAQLDEGSQGGGLKTMAS